MFERDLSVVTPCHNAAPFVERSLGELQTTLDSLGIDWEIVIVDDGSTDQTPAILDRCAGERCRVIHQIPNRGKGRAVAEGMVQAQGHIRIFTDIDLPYQMDDLKRCYEALAAGPHRAVFGNRKLSDSASETDIPLKRKIGSKVFSTYAGLIIGRYDLDTQCGLKGFDGELAECLFPLVTTDRFAFDVEIAYLLTAAGLEIGSIPVTLVNHDLSTITVFGSGLRTFIDAAGIWLRKLAGRYDVSTLRELSQKSA
jgi:dolichyl-phosphate beta-glucosyltransferase